MQTCCAVAEGGAYGEPQAGGNSFAYWFLAAALAGAAGFVSIAPHTVSNPLEGSSCNTQSSCFGDCLPPGCMNLVAMSTVLIGLPKGLMLSLPSEATHTMTAQP